MVVMDIGLNHVRLGRGAIEEWSGALMHIVPQILSCFKI